MRPRGWDQGSEAYLNFADSAATIVDRHSARYIHCVTGELVEKAGFNVGGDGEGDLPKNNRSTWDERPVADQAFAFHQVPLTLTSSGALSVGEHLLGPAESMHAFA